MSGRVDAPVLVIILIILLSCPPWYARHDPKQFIVLTSTMRIVAMDAFGYYQTPADPMPILYSFSGPSKPVM
jgi:hypothetical protein